jgi:UDP-N-acetylmuramoyl-L-alanyl-D-glutamate--2,6-diaminopimelate ligase
MNSDKLIEKNLILSNQSSKSQSLGSPTLVSLASRKIYHLLKSHVMITPFVFSNMLSRGYRFKLIGITGTDGKTTTATMLYNILKNDGKKVALITTIGFYKYDNTKKSKKNNIKNHDTLYHDTLYHDTGLHTTTPSAYVIHKLLKSVKDYDFVILEVTSHAIDQKRIAGLRFDTIIYTNITNEHLDYHKTWERYATCKSNLRLYAKFDGNIILNVDDTKSYNFLKSRFEEPRFRKARFSKNETLTYGIYHNADFRAVNITEGSFDIKSKYLSLAIKTNLFGEYNISNALAAIAALYKYDISLLSIQKTFADFPEIKGRFEILSKKPFTVVDFAHTPNAIYNVLENLSRYRDTRYQDTKYQDTKFKKTQKDKNNVSHIITIFGCPGERDKEKRPMMGESASLFSDIIIITADDPRFDDLGDIYKQVIGGIDQHKFKKDVNLYRIDQRDQAILFALEIAGKNDIIAVLGKGHEKSMAVKGEEIKWNDSDFIKEHLKSGVHNKNS